MFVYLVRRSSELLSFNFMFFLTKFLIRLEHFSMLFTSFLVNFDRLQFDMWRNVYFIFIAINEIRSIRASHMTREKRSFSEHQTNENIIIPHRIQLHRENIDGVPVCSTLDSWRLRSHRCLFVLHAPINR